MFKLTVFIVILSFLVGCAQKELTFSILANKKIDYARMNEYRKGRKPVSGQNNTNFILFIPLGVNNVEEALNDAIEEIPGAVGLVDGILTFNFWTAILFGRSYYEIKGTPLIDLRLRAKQKKETSTQRQEE